MGFPWQSGKTDVSDRGCCRWRWEIVLVLPFPSVSLLCGCSQCVLTAWFQFGEMVEDRSLFFFLVIFLIFPTYLALLGLVVGVYNTVLYSGDHSSVFSPCFTEKHSSCLTGTWKHSANSSNCLWQVSTWRRSLNCSMTIDSSSGGRSCTYFQILYHLVNYLSID